MQLTATLCDVCKDEKREFTLPQNHWGWLAISGQTETGHHYRLDYCGLDCARQGLASTDSLDSLVGVSA